MNLRRNHSPAIAGAKDSTLPPPTGSKRIPNFRLKRGRPANVAGLVRENEVLPMLNAAPGLRPVAVFEELCRRGRGGRLTAHSSVAGGERPDRDVIFARNIRRAAWACRTSPR
jgi:hypothetical protein